MSRERERERDVERLRTPPPVGDVEDVKKNGIEDHASGPDM